MAKAKLVYICKDQYDYTCAMGDTPQSAFERYCEDVSKYAVEDLVFYEAVEIKVKIEVQKVESFRIVKDAS